MSASPPLRRNSLSALTDLSTLADLSYLSGGGGGGLNALSMTEYGRVVSPVQIPKVASSAGNPAVIVSRSRSLSYASLGSLGGGSPFTASLLAIGPNTHASPSATPMSVREMAFQQRKSSLGGSSGHFGQKRMSSDSNSLLFLAGRRRKNTISGGGVSSGPTPLNTDAAQINTSIDLVEIYSVKGEATRTADAFGESNTCMANSLSSRQGAVMVSSNEEFSKNNTATEHNHATETVTTSTEVVAVEKDVVTSKPLAKTKSVLDLIGDDENSDFDTPELDAIGVFDMDELGASGSKHSSKAVYDFDTKIRRVSAGLETYRAEKATTNGSLDTAVKRSSSVFLEGRRRSTASTAPFAASTEGESSQLSHSELDTIEANVLDSALGRSGLGTEWMDDLADFVAMLAEADLRGHDGGITPLAAARLQQQAPMPVPMPVPDIDADDALSDFDVSDGEIAENTENTTSRLPKTPEQSRQTKSLTLNQLGQVLSTPFARADSAKSNDSSIDSIRTADTPTQDLPAFPAVKTGVAVATERQPTPPAVSKDHPVKGISPRRLTSSNNLSTTQLPPPPAGRQRKRVAKILDNQAGYSVLAANNKEQGCATNVSMPPLSAQEARRASGSSIHSPGYNSMPSIMYTITPTNSNSSNTGAAPTNSPASDVLLTDEAATGLQKAFATKYPTMTVPISLIKWFVAAGGVGASPNKPSTQHHRTPASLPATGTVTVPPKAASIRPTFTTDSPFYSAYQKLISVTESVEAVVQRRRSSIASGLVAAEAPMVDAPSPEVRLRHGTPPPHWSSKDNSPDKLPSPTDVQTIDNSMSQPRETASEKNSDTADDAPLPREPKAPRRRRAPSIMFLDSSAEEPSHHNPTVNRPVVSLLSPRSMLSPTSPDGSQKATNPPSLAGSRKDSNSAGNSLPTPFRGELSIVTPLLVQLRNGSNSVDDADGSYDGEEEKTSPLVPNLQGTLTASPLVPHPPSETAAGNHRPHALTSSPQRSRPSDRPTGETMVAFQGQRMSVAQRDQRLAVSRQRSEVLKSLAMEYLAAKGPAANLDSMF